MRGGLLTDHPITNGLAVPIKTTYDTYVCEQLCSVVSIFNENTNVDQFSKAMFKSDFSEHIRNVTWLGI